MFRYPSLSIALFLSPLLAESNLLAQETLVASLKGETAITSKPGDSKIIVGASNNYSGVEPNSTSHNTTNGGCAPADWTTVILPLPGGKDASADPTVDYDSNGNVYYCNTAYETEGEDPHLGGVYLYKSTNNGQSWETPITVHLPGSGQHDDKPWMIVDRVRNPNRVYVAWSRLNTNGTKDLLFSYAPTNNLTTNTFTTNLKLLRSGNLVGSTASVNEGVAMAVGQSGSNPPLYVAYVEDSVKADIYQANSATLYVQTSESGGTGFKVPKQVKSNFNSARTHQEYGSLRFFSFPAIAISPITGYIHLAWCEYGPPAGTLAVRFRRSTDANASWVDEGTIAPPITGTQQCQPFLSVNSDGRIFVTFYNFASLQAQLFSQVSTDNGVSFGQSYSHTTVTSNPLDGKGVTDYIGAIAPNDNPLPSCLWMDFRNGTPSSQPADVFFDQKLHLASNVSTATAGNGQRKLVKGQAANEYHLVYEANGEIWYTKTTDGGTIWSAERLISQRSGTSSYPCIAERAGNVYVVWQAYDSGYDVIIHNKNYNATQYIEFKIGYGTTGGFYRPAVTAHSSSAVTVMWYDTSTDRNIRKAYYNGSTWEEGSTGVVVASDARDPSLSVPNPPGATAKGAWRGKGLDAGGLAGSELARSDGAIAPSRCQPGR